MSDPEGTQRAAWLLLPLVVLCGCGKQGGELPVVPVSGQLLVQSRPAEGALVVLCPQGELASGDWTEGYPRGVVTGDGSFQVSTYGSDDGAPEGQYRVLVTWSKPTGNSESADPENETPDLLQGRYSDPNSSTLAATVAGPSTQLPPMDLK